MTFGRAGERATHMRPCNLVAIISTLQATWVTRLCSIPWHDSQALQIPWSRTQRQTQAVESRSQSHQFWPALHIRKRENLGLGSRDLTPILESHERVKVLWLREFRFYG
jgi:hypothetical protein